MKEYNVAVLGATGAVGQQMMKVLEERNFPVKRLLPLLDDGGDSLTTRQVRRVAERLKRRLSVPLYFMPEFLSSEEAWSDLREAGVRRPRRKDVLDQQAAVRILQSFLSLPPDQRVPA